MMDRTTTAGEVFSYRFITRFSILGLHLAIVVSTDTADRRARDTYRQDFRSISHAML